MPVPNDEPSAEPFELEGLVVATLPDAPRGTGWSWRALGGPALGLSIGWIGLYTGAFNRGRPTPIVLYVVLAVFVSVLVSIGLFVVPRAARRRASKLLAEGPSDWSRAIIGCAVAGSTFESEGSLAARWRALLDRAGRPRTVLHAELVPSVRGIELRPELLEPEAINQSQYGAMVIAVMFGWFAVMNGLNFQVGGWWKSLLFGSVAVVFLLRVPRIRDRIPMLRDTGRDLVAGPGWLRDRRSRRWTVADSMAIVFRTHKGRTKPGVIVRFIGPAGVRDVSFENAANPDFALLWERWMHPRPRLDLEA